jgi:putative oxidoreductase
MKKLFSTTVSDNALSFALFILRVGTGFLMLADHGLDKLVNFAQKSSTFPDPFGVGSTTSLALTVFAEFFCAAFIILGLFTRLAAIPLVIAMSVAFFHSNKMDYASRGGELSLLFLICFLTILIAGPGKASVDRLINK